MSLQKCQLKQQWDSTPLPIRMVKIWNADNTKCWWRCGAMGTLIRCLWEYKMVQPLWMTIWRFHTKLNTLLPYDPATSLFDFTQRSWNLCTKACTQMFIVALFIITQTWKQPRYPSVDECVVHPDNGILFSFKSHELSTHETTWRKLKCIYY